MPPTPLKTPRPLLPVERAFLLKQRANLMDQLTFVETTLGIPSSLRSKHERRATNHLDRGDRNRVE